MLSRGIRSAVFFCLFYLNQLITQSLLLLLLLLSLLIVIQSHLSANLATVDPDVAVKDAGANVIDAALEACLGTEA